MVCLVVSSVMSVTGAAIITRAVVSIVTLAAAGWCILTSTAHANLPCFTHRSIGVARAELGVQKRKPIFEGGWAPAKAVFGGPAITTAAPILYTGLATRVFGKKGRP